MAGIRKHFSWLTLVLLGGTAALGQQGLALRGTIPEAERVWSRTETAPMTFRLGRRSGAMSCGVDCAEFIIAEGDIRPDTADHFNALMARVRRPLPVYLSSSGGNLDGGLALGRALRLWQSPVLVGQRAALACTTAAGCTAEDERSGITIFSEARMPAVCNSACVYTFAGGVTRGLIPGSSLGIHQFFVAHAGDPTRTPKARYSHEDFSHIQRMVSHVAAYLTTMGVDTRVLALASEIDAGAIRRLSTHEVQNLNLTTAEAPPAVASATPKPRRFEPPAPAQMHHVAISAPARASTDWPMVERDGRPFIVLTAPTVSRRFGEIANEVAIGCPSISGRYSASFREIVPMRPMAEQDADVIVGSISGIERLTGSGGISRATALAAARSGTLELQVTSSATAGYPMRVDLPGTGLATALETLEAACRK